MLKSLQNVWTVSRQTLNHHGFQRIRQYATKSSPEQLIRNKNEVTKWIESMNEADQKKIRYIQNEVENCWTKCVVAFSPVVDFYRDLSKSNYDANGKFIHIIHCV